MAYNTENVLTSERAYDVFSEVVTKKEGTYSRKLSEDIGIDQSLASEILSNLTEVGVIQKGKRTRAQYYEIDPEGLKDTFYNLWNSLADRKDIEEEDLPTIFDEIENREVEKNLAQLLTLFSENYARQVEESNIQLMLVSDFYKELEDLILSVEEPDSYGIPERFQEEIEDLEDWIAILHLALWFIYRDVNTGSLKAAYKQIENLK